jgi:hypothetical protein
MAALKDFIVRTTDDGKTFILYGDERRTTFVVILFVCAFVFPWPLLMREGFSPSILSTSRFLSILALLGGVISFLRWARCDVISVSAHSITMQRHMGALPVGSRVKFDRRRLTCVVIREVEIPTRGIPYIHRSLCFLSDGAELAHTLPLSAETARCVAELSRHWALG